MTAEDAEFTVAAKCQRTPVIAELALRPDGELLRYQPGQYVLLGEPGPVLYLAGGSGLAPVRALAQAALRDRTRPPVVLFFSARMQQDLIDDGRFRSWQCRHPQFRYLRTVTRADGPPPTGRIPVILGDWFPGLSGWRVYIAGAPGFVTACAAAARACGARPSQVYTEEFFTEPRPWGAAQPAAAAGSR